MKATVRVQTVLYYLYENMEDKTQDIVYMNRTLGLQIQSSLFALPLDQS